MDALAESYYSHSPYAYTMNDPINHVDILGLCGTRHWNSNTEQWEGTRGVSFGFAGIPEPIHGSSAGGGGGGIPGSAVDKFFEMGGGGEGSSISAWYAMGGASMSLEGFLASDWKWGMKGSKAQNFIRGIQHYRSTQYGKKLAGAQRKLSGVCSAFGPNSFASLKALAWFLHNSPYMPVTCLNPFYGMVAIGGDIGALFVAGEADPIGGLFVLAGKDAGKIFGYSELSEFNVAAEGSAGTEFYIVDFSGDADDFKAEYFFGARKKAWGNVGLQPGTYGFGVGFTYSWTDVPNTQYRVRSFGYTAGFGLSPLPISGGYNEGIIIPW